MLLQRVKFSSFLRLRSIPLCKCPIVVFITHVLMDCWAASISWLFKITAMNIRVLMFFCISVLGFFRYVPRSGLAGS